MEDESPLFTTESAQSLDELLDAIDELIERIESVTADDLQNLANDFFRTENIAVTVLGNLNGLKLTRDQLAC